MGTLKGVILGQRYVPCYGPRPDETEERNNSCRYLQIMLCGMLHKRGSIEIADRLESCYFGCFNAEVNEIDRLLFCWFLNVLVNNEAISRTGPYTRQSGETMRGFYKKLQVIITCHSSRFNLDIPIFQYKSRSIPISRFHV